MSGNTSTGEPEWISGVRILANAFIVVAGIVSLCWGLHVAIGFKGQGTLASDVVAIMGAITPFLGTAIGVYFGINVSQAGAAQASAAASHANTAAAQANHAADQANNIASHSRREAEQLKASVASKQRAIDALVKMVPEENQANARRIVSE